MDTRADQFFQPIYINDYSNGKNHTIDPSLYPWLRIIDLNKIAKDDQYFPELQDRLFCVIVPELGSYTIMESEQLVLFSDVLSQRINLTQLNKKNTDLLVKWRKIGLFHPDGLSIAGYPPQTIADIRDISNFQVYLEVTNRCELKCRYCYKGESEDTSLPLSVIEKILDEHPKGDAYITLSGGEFFLHPNWKDILNKCNQAGINFTIQTNGIAIDDSIIQLLASLDSVFWNIEISLDSLQQPTLNVLRPGTNIKSILEKIKQFEIYGLSRRILIHAVLTSYNFAEIKEMVEFAVDHNLGGIRFSRLYRKGFGLDCNDIRLHHKVFDAYYEQEYSFFEQYSRYMYLDFIALSNRSCVPVSSDKPGVPFASCRMFFRKIGVASTGKVYFCKDAIGDPYFELGDLSTDSLSDCVNSSRRKEITLRGFAQVSEEHRCKFCLWKNMCTGCIVMNINTGLDCFKLCDDWIELCEYKWSAYLRDIVRNYYKNSRFIETHCQKPN